MIHSYKIGGFNIILDIASGSIHSAPDVAFDIIGMEQTQAREDIIKLIKQKYDSLNEQEIIEIFSDIDELVSRGVLFSPDIYQSFCDNRNNVSLKALCLNVSHMCNMTCTYCFAGDGEYNAQGLMSFETGKRAIDFLVENSGNHKRLDIDFFGGEPLLNWDVVKDIVNYTRKNEATWNKFFRFTLTTNGLLIDDDVISFTEQHMYNVVLSLDGRREVNDNMRCLLGGGGSYDKVLPKFKKLVEARGGKDYYIRGTFTRKNLDFSNDILHLADLGFSELSMEPVVADPDLDYALKISDLPKIFEQYELLANEMLKREKQGRGFRFYHFMLELLRGPCVHKRLAGCGVGCEYLAVTPQGELFACHQFIGNNEFLMGDIFNGIDNLKLREKFIRRNIYSMPECNSCWAKMYCSGGCAANAYNDSGSVLGVHKLGCEMFKKRIECAVMMKVAQS